MNRQKVINSSFVVFSVENKLNNCQFGISIPKKLVKKVVYRNRLTDKLGKCYNIIINTIVQYEKIYI